MKKLLSLFILAMLLSAASAQRRLAFRPATHGFHFPNSFHSSVKVAGDNREAFRTDGLCGGMVLAAFNYFRYRVPIPAFGPDDMTYDVSVQVPAIATSTTSPLIDYIFHSQIATFQNVSAISFSPAFKPDYSAEYNKVKARIDRGEYLILGLQMRPGQSGFGHQVLAYGYNDATKEVYIYDPNFPDKEICICAAVENNQPVIVLKCEGNVVESRYKAMFEQQELFVNRISDRTTYDMTDNVVRNLNFAVRPPNITRATVATASNVDLERVLPFNAVYEFMNVQNNKMVEVEDALFSKGNKVQQYANYEQKEACDGHNQKWMVIPAGQRSGKNVYYIINFGFRKYLQAGNRVTVEPGNDQNNQLWVLELNNNRDAVFIKSFASGQYLQVPATRANDGEWMELGNFTGSGNQLFMPSRYTGYSNVGGYRPCSFRTIQPQYNNNKSVIITNASPADATSIVLNDLQPGAAHGRWQFADAGRGYFKITSPLGSGKCIDVRGTEAGNGSGLESWYCADQQDKQKWLIFPSVREPGYFMIFNKISGRCMEVAGGAVNDNGVRVQTYLFHDGNNQKWRLGDVR